ncbi:MAG TPA: F-box protein [Myxococcota bacterium]|nr:F-box protein [Myxococcota bacterium]
MLDRLPNELSAQILRNLDAKDLRALELTSRRCREVAIDHGWGMVAYGNVPFVHAGVPTTSVDWRALAKERRLLERTLGRNTGSDSVALARQLVALGDNRRAAIALQRPPPYPQPLQEWALTVNGVGAALNLPAVIDRSTALLHQMRELRIAVTADDVNRLARYLTAPMLISASLFSESLQKAVQGRSKTFAAFTRALSNSPLYRERLLEAGCDPVRLALEHGKVDMLKTAIAGKFPLTASHMEQIRSLRHAHQQEGLTELLRVVGPTVSLGREPLVPFDLRNLAAPRDLNPFLACLTLDRPVLPALRLLRARGADPHSVDRVNGFNAWHFLASGDVADFAEVAAYLRGLKVNIAHTGGPRSATPLTLALANSRCLPGQVATLIRCGASPQGRHLDDDAGKSMTALQFALSTSSNGSGKVRVLLEEKAAPTTNRELTTGVTSRYLSAKTLELLIASPFRWTQRSLDAAFLTYLRRGDRNADDMMVVLRALSRAGASADIFAEPHWHGEGKKARRQQGLAVCPGTLSSAGLAIVAAQEARALPLLRLLADELGAELGATGSHGANVWHALALSPCADAMEVADFLAERDVNILAAAKAEGEDVAWTPLDAIIRYARRNPALKDKFQTVAEQQSSKRRRLDG